MNYLLMFCQGEDLKIQKLNKLYETGFFTILILWGIPGQPERMSIWPWYTEIKECNKADIQKIVKNWFLSC